MSMQTLLPYPDFARSAKCLDLARLSKQRGIVKQLLTAIYVDELRKNVFLAEQVKASDKIYGDYYQRLREYSACVQWESHPQALMAYGLAMCLEWVERGNADSINLEIIAFNLEESVFLDQAWMSENRPELLPPWLGDERVHASHRSMLIATYESWYRRFWDDEACKKYFWPGRDYQRGEANRTSAAVSERDSGGEVRHPVREDQCHERVVRSERQQSGDRLMETVGELIEALQQYPPETPVVRAMTVEYGNIEIEQVSLDLKTKKVVID